MRQKYITLIMVLFVTLISCEEELKPYNYEKNTLGFEYDRNQYNQIDDSIKRYSFAFEHSTVLQDTVWIDVRTTGYIVDYDRPVKLRQEIFVDEREGENLHQAESGVHFVALDDETVNIHYYIPAGKNQNKLPLIIKRDTSLKTNKYFIKLVVEDNEYFTQSYEHCRERVVEISDILIEPANWSGAFKYYIGGDYGQVKHQFMIDVSGQKIDEEYIAKVLDPYDAGYINYLSNYYATELRKLNAKREEEKLGPLREKPIKDGVPGALVRFNNFGQVIE